MKDEGRIALEVSITSHRRGDPDVGLHPWFCYLDSWNGRELADFINAGLDPHLTAANMPLLVNQLFITPRKEAVKCS